MVETKKTFIERFKSAKFIFLNLLVLAILGYALLSGNAGNILSNYYQKVTGEKFETFSPVTDISNQSYQILKYKLVKNNVKIEDSLVEIFKISELEHKYRVTTNAQTLEFIVQKQASGVWKIDQVDQYQP